MAQTDSISVAVGSGDPVLCNVVVLVQRSHYMRALITNGMATSTLLAATPTSQVLRIPSCRCDVAEVGTDGERACAERDALHTQLWGLLGHPADKSQELCLGYLVALWQVLNGTSTGTDTSTSTESASKRRQCAMGAARDEAVHDEAAARCAFCAEPTSMTDVCAACLVAARPPKSWCALPPTWWGKHLGDISAFAHFHGAPALLAHVLNLMNRRLLPPSADVMSLLEILGEGAMAAYLDNHLDCNKDVRVGAANLTTLALTTLAPFNPAFIWKQLRRFHEGVGDVHWLQRHAGVLDVAAFGARLVESEHALEFAVPRLGLSDTPLSPSPAPPSPSSPSSSLFSPCSPPYAPLSPSSPPSSPPFTPSSPPSASPVGGKRQRQRQMPSPFPLQQTVAKALGMPLHTDVDEVLCRLCEAYPLLGTPWDVITLLKECPGVVIAGGAVAYAVSAHPTRNAQPGNDIDVWVLDPVEQPACAAYAARVDAEVRLDRHRPAAVELDLGLESAAALYAAAKSHFAKGHGPHMGEQTCRDIVSQVQRRVHPGALYASARRSVVTLHALATAPVQIIHTQAATLSHLLWSFDLPHVQVGLRYDHAAARVVVEATADFCETMRHGAINWWKEFKSTPERLAKALKRGFVATTALTRRAAEADPVKRALATMRECRVTGLPPALELATLLHKTGADEAYVVSDDVWASFSDAADGGTKRWMRVWHPPMAPGGFQRGGYYPQQRHDNVTVKAFDVPMTMRPYGSYFIRAHLGRATATLCRATWEVPPSSSNTSTKMGHALWGGSMSIQTTNKEVIQLWKRVERTSCSMRDEAIFSGGKDEDEDIPSGDGDEDRGEGREHSVRLWFDHASRVTWGTEHTAVASLSGKGALIRAEVEGVVGVEPNGRIDFAGLRVAHVWVFPRDFLAQPA